jgi:hypothetical protein
VVLVVPSLCTQYLSKESATQGPGLEVYLPKLNRKGRLEELGRSFLVFFQLLGKAQPRGGCL